MSNHRVVVHPGDQIDIVLVERQVNGSPDALAYVCLTWQDRDAPEDEIATKGRELQINVQVGHAEGRVGPVVVTQR